MSEWTAERRARALVDALNKTAFAGHYCVDSNVIRFAEYFVICTREGYRIGSGYVYLESKYSDNVDTVIEHIRKILSNRMREESAANRDIARALEILHDLIWCPFAFKKIMHGDAIMIELCGKRFDLSLKQIYNGTADLKKIYAQMRMIEDFIAPARLPEGLLPGPIAEEIVYWART